MTFEWLVAVISVTLLILLFGVVFGLTESFKDTQRELDRMNDQLNYLRSAIDLMNHETNKAIRESFMSKKDGENK